MAGFTFNGLSNVRNPNFKSSSATSTDLQALQNKFGRSMGYKGQLGTKQILRLAQAQELASKGATAQDELALKQQAQDMQLKLQAQQLADAKAAAYQASRTYDSEALAGNASNSALAAQANAAKTNASGLGRAELTQAQSAAALAKAQADPRLLGAQIQAGIAGYQQDERYANNPLADPQLAAQIAQMQAQTGLTTANTGTVGIQNQMLQEQLRAMKYPKPYLPTSAPFSASRGSSGSKSSGGSSSASSPSSGYKSSIWDGPSTQESLLATGAHRSGSAAVGQFPGAKTNMAGGTTMGGGTTMNRYPPGIPQYNKPGMEKYVPSSREPTGLPTSSLYGAPQTNQQIAGGEATNGWTPGLQAATDSYVNIRKKLGSGSSTTSSK